MPSQSGWMNFRASGRDLVEQREDGDRCTDQEGDEGDDFTHGSAREADRRGDAQEHQDDQVELGQA